ncbi:unnamed protein product [Adineta ricciae]|uniref:C2 domain-containing protein n=1 Tax=Adineta ricciae TaxID=249248 RepID=A0A816H077_ADIRI|nr:unnamed protein product [Adineta ricciae]
MAQLQVTIIAAKNLTKKDTFSENDPFVEVYLDNKQLKKRTKTEQNSKFPHWNETFVFNHLTGQDTLHVHIYDEDQIKDEKIGSVIIDLHQLYELGHINRWYELTGKAGSTSSEGQIHLILDFERLKI